MIDTHCHLTYPGLFEIKEKVIAECKKRMDAVITCGYPKDAKEALKLGNQHEGFVYVTLGLHPVDIIKMTDKEVEEYWDFIRSYADEIVGVGEIGLDKYHFPSEKHHERFVDTYVQGLNLAKELKLPVVLHMRKTVEEGFRLLVKNDVKKAVFHCYSGNVTLAKEIISHGYFVSIATNINHSKNSKKVAKKLPLQKILTETDSPFLSPILNKVNVPQNVEVVLQKIAEQRGITFEEVAKITSNNAFEFFKLKRSTT